jgi:preprotein translocase subunit Sec61beta
MNLFIAFFKNISLITFAAVWLILNVSFPSEISLNYPYNPITKDWVLYASLAFVGMFNLIMVFFLRMLQNIPIQNMRLPQADFWKENEISRDEFFKVLKAWFYTFMTFINLYVAFILYKIWDINVMIQDAVSLLPFWILGIGIFIAWIVFLAIRFRIRKYSIWD